MEICPRVDSKETAVEQWLRSSAKLSQGTVAKLEMTHLHPELEAIIATEGRCMRSERSLYAGH